MIRLAFNIVFEPMKLTSSNFLFSVFCWLYALITLIPVKFSLNVIVMLSILICNCLNKGNAKIKRITIQIVINGITTAKTIASLGFV